jgi:hypothetical protein
MSEWPENQQMQSHAVVMDTGTLTCVLYNTMMKKNMTLTSSLVGSSSLSDRLLFWTSLTINLISTWRFFLLRGRSSIQQYWSDLSDVVLHLTITPTIFEKVYLLILLNKVIPIIVAVVICKIDVLLQTYVILAGLGGGQEERKGENPFSPFPIPSQVDKSFHVRGWLWEMLPSLYCLPLSLYPPLKPSGITYRLIIILTSSSHKEW